MNIKHIVAIVLLAITQNTLRGMQEGGSEGQRNTLDTRHLSLQKLEKFNELETRLIQNQKMLTTLQDKVIAKPIISRPNAKEIIQGLMTTGEKYLKEIKEAKEELQILILLEEFQ